MTAAQFRTLKPKRRRSQQHESRVIPSARYKIGIDPGIESGFAVWDSKGKSLQYVASVKLYELFPLVTSFSMGYIEVFIENPNTWVPFGKTSTERLQGAGAVKQTYKHIIEFLTHHGIPFTPTRLQDNIKKLSAGKFRQITKCEIKTNEHGRDAAMIVWGR